MTKDAIDAPPFLIKMHGKSGVKIGLKELNVTSIGKSSIKDIINYLVQNITPSLLKKAIDENIVKFCENWYRGKYVDGKSGETHYIYFEGMANIPAKHHTTYTCGLPPPPGWAVRRRHRRRMVYVS